MDHMDLKKSRLRIGLVLLLCLFLLALPVFADGDDETELDSGFVHIGIGETQPDPEPAEEPEEPAPDPEQEDPDPETGNENETEMSGGFVSIDVGETGSSPAPETGAPTAVRFSDVTAEKWYAEAVTEAASQGIMNGMGDGTFAPQANLTRAMLVQILYNLEGRPAASGGAPFRDVASDAWYSPAVARLPARSWWRATEGIMIPWRTSPANSL